MKTKDEYSLEFYLKKLSNSAMLPYNKRKIQEYYNEKIANGVKKTSYILVLRIMTRLGEAFTAKKFEDITKGEMVSFFNEMKPGKHSLTTKDGVVIEFPAKPFSENTMWQYKALVKTFYNWLFGKESDETPPEAVRWIKRLGNKNDKPWDKFKKEILSIQEANRMINSAKNTRDKALIAILWETGLRASELLGMRKSDLQGHKEYIEFEAQGKTGKRTAIIVQSKPHLEEWLTELEKKKHELPKELQDFIWPSFTACGLSSNKMGDHVLTRDSLNTRLKMIAKQAGIRKRVWTHGLRHSAATRDAANGWNEARLRIKYGWSRKSNMPSVYTHLANTDLKKVVLEENGIIEQKDREEKSLLENMTKCMFCFTINLKENKYCNRCGKPLNIEHLKVMEKKAEHMDKLQEMIIQELEKKGVDLGEIAKILATKEK